MAEYTSNYKLEKQQGNEYININGINSNFDKIDTELEKKAQVTTLVTLQGSAVSTTLSEDSVLEVVRIEGGTIISPANKELPISPTNIADMESADNFYIYSCGKNLFDGKIEQGSIGSVGENNDNAARLRSANYTLMKAGTYTVSFTGADEYRATIYNLEKTFVREDVYKAKNTSITLTEDCFVRFAFRYSNSANILPSDISKIQVQVGSIADTYEHYKSSSVFVVQSTRGLTNGVKDTIEKINGEWYHIKRIGKLSAITGIYNITNAKLNGFYDCSVLPPGILNGTTIVIPDGATADVHFEFATPIKTKLNSLCLTSYEGLTNVFTTANPQLNITCDFKPKLCTVIEGSVNFATPGGAATDIIIDGIVLQHGVSKTFIVGSDNNGQTTTINGKRLYKPNTTTSPTLKAGKAVTVWYDTTGDCFFIKASAEGTARAEHVLAPYTISNEEDTGIVGTMPFKDTSTNYLAEDKLGGDGVILLKPQKGYYEPAGQSSNQGSAAGWVYATETNFSPPNLLAGKKYFGMDGGIPTAVQNGYGHIPATQLSVGSYSGDGKRYAYLGLTPGSYIDKGTYWVQSEQPHLLPENIVSPKVILGIQGTAKPLDGGINGVIRNYYVYAGKNISAGDFVNFITGVSGIGAGTATERQLMPCNKFRSACALDDKRVLIAYQEDDSDLKPKLIIVSIDGVELTVGTAFYAEPCLNGSVDYSMELIRLSTTKALLVYAFSYYVYANVVNISGNVITSMGEYQKVYQGSDTLENFYIMSFLNGGSVKCVGSADVSHASVFIQVNKNSYPYIQFLGMTISDNAVTGSVTYIASFSSSGSSAVKFGSTINNACTKAYAFVKDGNQSVVSFYGYSISGEALTRTIYTSQGGQITSGNNGFMILCCGEDNLMMYNEAKVDGTNNYSYAWGIKVNHSTGTISVKTPVLVTAEYAPSLNSYVELASNKIMMLYRTSSTNRARVISFDSSANLSLGAEVSGQRYMSKSYFLPGTSKSIVLGAVDGSTQYNGGIIYNCPATIVEFLNYLYETQVTPSTDNNVNGVALTYGVGGILSGSGASHKDAVRVSKRV